MLSSIKYIALESVLYDLFNVPAGPRGPGGPAKKVSRKSNRMEQNGKDYTFQSETLKAEFDMFLV